jgi:hypothetical protein
MKLLLASVAALALTPGLVHADGMLMPVRGVLCDSAAHAILFADCRAKGESEEIARDRVGRAAKAEVCGIYRGIAVIESEAVSLSGGVAYKVTAFRFQEDQRVAWLAETSFAPAHAAWSL